MVNLHKPAQYYYSLLSNEQRQVYNTILSGIRRFEYEIQLPLTPVSVVSTIWEHVMLDNPLVFYVSSFEHFFDWRKRVKAIRPKYSMQKQSAKQNINIITEYMQNFEHLMNKSEIEKECYT